VSFRQSICASLLVTVSIVSFNGCGGTAVDVTKPVEVTDEMKRQAEASDKFFTAKSKTKKSAE